MPFTNRHLYYITVLNKKPKIYSFSDVTFQNFPPLTAKICDFILLKFRTVRTKGCGVLDYLKDFIY